MKRSGCVAVLWVDNPDRHNQQHTHFLFFQLAPKRLCPTTASAFFKRKDKRLFFRAVTSHFLLPFVTFLFSSHLRSCPVPFTFRCRSLNTLSTSSLEIGAHLCSVPNSSSLMLSFTQRNQTCQKLFNAGQMEADASTRWLKISTMQLLQPHTVVIWVLFLQLISRLPPASLHPLPPCTISKSPVFLILYYYQPFFFVNLCFRG